MRTWVEISLDAIAKNLKAVRRISGKQVMAVVKADAYGHGALQVAERLQAEKADYLAVATAEEAYELRKGGIRLPILILSPVLAEDIPHLAGLDVSVTLVDREQAVAYSKAVGPDSIKTHIKLDTGLSRLGFTDFERAESVCRLPGLKAEGIFSHLATADMPNDAFVRDQLEKFELAVRHMENKGLYFAFKHCANSGGVVNYPQSFGNMVRAGISLYGWEPDGSENARFEPAMRWQARIAQIKRLSAGATVSYSRRYTCQDERTIAVLSCGYADGVHRVLSNKGYVLVNGRPAPIRGNICMDMMMVDVTGIEGVESGQAATLLGHDDGAFLSANAIAEWAGTISYEILCAVSARVLRIYV